MRRNAVPLFLALLSSLGHCLRSTDALAVMNNAVLTVAAVQPPLREDEVSPMDSARAAERMMREAMSAESVGVARGIDIFVLPELSPIGYSEHTFAAYLPNHSHGSSIGLGAINDEIEQLFSKFALKHDVYVCFGTVGVSKNNSADHSEESHLTIRQVVLNNNGNTIAQYDKILLCDYGDCAETRFFSPGTELCSFECRGFRVGLIICADMRNPLLSRELAGKHGVDVIFQPAAFSRDISFRTWKSFRETRAVENSVYFVGVNYAGKNYGDTSFVGPWVDENNEPEVLDTNPGVLIGTVQKTVLDKVRKEMPYHRQLMVEFA